MKKWIAMLLVCVITLSLPMNVIAETIEYPSVVVTLKGYNNSAEDEAKYREVAAKVIGEYYWAYCQYNMDDLYESKLKDKEWVEEIPTEYMKGFYRYYYTAANLKTRFDKEKKTEYSTMKPNDSKKGEEWEKTQKEMYLIMLSETIAAKVRANPSAFFGESYTFNVQTGEFEWDFYTEAINAVGRQEVYQAWSDFIVDMSQTVLSVIADANFSPKTKDKTVLTMNDVIQAIIDGAEDVLDEGLDTYFENNINKWSNEIVNISKRTILSNVEHANSQIVSYLKNIANDPEFEAIFANPIEKELLLEAMDEILAVYDANDNAKLLIDTWFDENGFSLEEILDGNDILCVVLYATVKEVLETALDLAKKACDNYMTDMAEETVQPMPEDAYFNLTGIIDAVFNGFSSAITEILDDEIKQIKEGGSSVFDDELSTKILNKFAQSMVKDLSGFLAKDFSGKEIGRKERAGGFSDLISTITTMMSEWHENYEGASEDDRKEFKVKYAWKMADCVANHLTNYWGEAIKAAPKKVGKYAKELETNNKKFSIKKFIDLIYEPAKSLAETCYKSVEVSSGEDEDSYKAAKMYNCMIVSNKYRQMAQSLIIEKLRNVNLKSKDELEATIKNDEIIGIEDIQNILNYVMMQIEQDMIGQKYLMDILAKNENNNQSKFYKYLMKNIEDGDVWEFYMRYTKAKEIYNNMRDYSNKWENLLDAA